VGCAIAPNTEFIVAARFVLGLAAGGASATVSVFLSELAPSQQRGQIVSANELMIVTGQLLAYTSNALMATHFPGESVWRWMLAIRLWL
jgi:major inositol transporter-like SP family MFS transporter